MFIQCTTTTAGVGAAQGTHFHTQKFHAPSFPTVCTFIDGQNAMGNGGGDRRLWPPPLHLLLFLLGAVTTSPAGGRILPTVAQTVVVDASAGAHLIPSLVADLSVSTCPLLHAGLRADNATRGVVRGSALWVHLELTVQHCFSSPLMDTGEVRVAQVDITGSGEFWVCVPYSELQLQFGGVHHAVRVLTVTAAGQ
jgi:hypothetical protein